MAEAKLRTLPYVDETILRPANFLDEEIFRKSEPRLIEFVRRYTGKTDLTVLAERCFDAIENPGGGTFDI